MSLQKETMDCVEWNSIWIVWNAIYFNISRFETKDLTESSMAIIRRGLRQILIIDSVHFPILHRIHLIIRTVPTNSKVLLPRFMIMQEM